MIKISTSDVYKLFFLILFLLSMFLGSLRFPFGPIRLDFIFDFAILFSLIFFIKKFNIKCLVKALPFCSFIIYYLLWLPLHYNELLIRDYLFVIIPFYSFITYFILSVLVNNISLNFIYKLLCFYIIINFVVAVTQYTNIGNLNSVLGFYYQYIANNNSCSIQYESLNQRPFGLIGNPTNLTFLSYVIYKLVSNIKHNKFIAVIAYITMLISGGRMVLFFIAIWEPIQYIYIRFIMSKSLKQIKNSLFKIMTTIVFIIALIIVFMHQVPFLYIHVLEPLVEKRLFDGYSYTYRFSMYGLLFNAGIKTFLFGGYSYDDFIKQGIEYVDSEIVMRTLQFGIFGYIALLFPLIAYCSKSKFNINIVFILAICFEFGITHFTISNYALIFYIILYLVIETKILENGIDYNKNDCRELYVSNKI